MLEGLKYILYNYGLGIAAGFVAALLIYCGLRSQKTAFKLVAYNLAALFVFLFIVEGVGFCVNTFTSNPDASANLHYSGSFFDNPFVSGRKGELGFGPKEDTAFVATAMRKNKNEIIYNVSYTLENGIRKTPNTNKRGHNYIWFLGCSFTFGDGLNDSETLPAYTTNLADSGCQVINYGFSGYGTHQALKLVENKILNPAFTPRIDTGIVIYSFIPEHFVRAAGKAAWDGYGPRYEVENGLLSYKGSFNDNVFFKDNYVNKRLKSIWHSSTLYKTVFRPKASNGDVTRVLELVKRMNTELAQHHVAFYILLAHNDKPEPELDLFYSELKKSRVNCIYIDSIIPEVKTKPGNYYIKGDGHPNKNYNQKVAEYLAAHQLNGFFTSGKAPK